MLEERDLKSLLQFEVGHPVLSVYLNVEPAERGSEALRRRLRSLVRDFPGEAAQDVGAVEQYLEHEFDGSGRCLALFSSAPASFFRAFAFQIPIRSRARWLPRPYVKPLADLLDAYGGYGVALVDRQGVRLYSFHLGELVESTEWAGESVRRTKRGGASAVAGRRGGVAGQTRHEEEIAGRNLKEAAEVSARFFQSHQVRRILLGGTEETVSQFRSHLAKTLQSLVVGTFRQERAASPADVLAKALEVGQLAEQSRRAALIDSAITAAAKGKGGTVGLDDTLRALHEGRVQVLIISEGFRAAGTMCEGCSFVSELEFATCPYCGKASRPIEDAVEHAVQKAMTTAIDVEVIRDSPELERAGRMAALLRY